MKIKIIDLLNKIANGEDVPMFKYENKRFKYSEFESWFEDLDDNEYCKTGIDLCDLNDEVEIIEDNKKIEKIKYYDYLDKSKIIDKINEIIDKLNEGDE